MGSNLFVLGFHLWCARVKAKQEDANDGFPIAQCITNVCPNRVSKFLTAGLQVVMGFGGAATTFKKNPYIDLRLACSTLRYKLKHPAKSQMLNNIDNTLKFCSSNVCRPWSSYDQHSPASSQPTNQHNVISFFHFSVVAWMSFFLSL